MANRNHVKILRSGVKYWNKWREENPKIIPNLSEVNLINADLSKANLSRTILNHAVLSEAKLIDADLTEADLSDSHLYFTDCSNAKLIHAQLSQADLKYAKFHNAQLVKANLDWANLTQADLSHADLNEASFYATILVETDLTDTLWDGATLFFTILSDLDFSTAKGIDTVHHLGPSHVSLSTLLKNSGKVSNSFWRGCGVPDDVIDYLPSFTQQPFQYESCFISYSTKDEEFTRRLYERMKGANLRVWFAPEDGAGGKKLHEQIEQAIQLHDRLLIVLSENSLKSEWVMTEIRKARKQELKRGTRKLFPISLVDARGV